MKRYIRAIAMIKIVADSWEDFLKKIEELSPYKVDPAYRRRVKGDNWIKLLDEDGNEYDAEITEYSDGSFELLGCNINKSKKVEGATDMKRMIRASHYSAMKKIQNDILDIVEALEKQKSNASTDEQEDLIDSAIKHLKIAAEII